jgi:tight adherence protein B
MSTMYYVFGIAIFVAAVLLVEGAYIWWSVNKGSHAQRLAQRLESVSDAWHSGADEFSILKQRVFSKSPALHTFMQGMPGVASLDGLLIHSGLGWNVARFIATTAVAAMMGLAVLLFLRFSWLVALGGALLCAFLPLLHVLRAKRKRLTRIEEQLPDAVDLMARALRAGHAFPNTVKMVGDELTQPIAGEFRALFDEVNYGVSMQDALLSLASRVPSTDLKYLVIAVLIQRETGGNLAELLDNIGGVIRARLKLFGTIRVLSSEGRLSAWILGLLPFGTATFIQLVNPDFLKVLWTDPAGVKMIGAALTMMFLGALWMRKIIRIRV